MNFVDKVNNGKGVLMSLLSIKAYSSIKSFTVCFKLWHQIEIRVLKAHY
jgi:hypothetical protein